MADGYHFENEKSLFIILSKNTDIGNKTANINIKATVSIMLTATDQKQQNL